MALDDVVARLSRRSFDASVIFTVFSQNPLPTAMLCYMAGIRRVAAYCRENPYALLSEWLPDTEPLYRTRHEVQRQIDLVTYLGAKPASANLSLAVPSDRDDEVRFTLRAAGVNTDGTVVTEDEGARVLTGEVALVVSADDPPCRLA